MKERINQIIEYRTGGRKNTFAELMGWRPQYLNTLLHGMRIGIVPVQTIVAKIPELNARWLLTGEGEMIDRSVFSAELDRFEKLIAFMDEDQRRALAYSIQSGTLPRFEEAERAQLEQKAEQWQRSLDSRFASVQEKMKKANEICKAKESK